MEKHFEHRFLLAFILLLTGMLAIDAHAVNKYEHYFLPLDSVFNRRAEYEKMLDLQIQDLKLQRSRTTELGERYLINKMLYNKYMYYICDSALVYMDENEGIALALNNKEWLNEVYMERGNIYIRTGLLRAAGYELDKVDIDNKPASFKAKYYSLRMFLLEQEKIFTGISNHHKIDEYSQELMNYTTDDDESYVWSMHWSYQGEDKNEKIIEFLEKEYEKNIASNNINAGNNALVIALTYRDMNNEEQKIKYLCLAVRSDIRHVNRDPTALMELVSFLSQTGDSKRAYTYLDYVLQSQSYYPDRIRGPQMAQYMKRIFEETQARSDAYRHQTSVYLFWLSVAVVLLAVLAVIIWLSLRRQFRQKKNISEINQQLNANVEELSRTQQELILSNRKMQEATNQILDTNRELKEVNYIKEKYIGYLFSACSNYINKMEEFRQLISRKLKTGQAEDVVRLTQPANSFLHNEIKELNQTFDSTFLSIYPDFVADFNSLLREGEGFVVHSSGDLNTELRIFALVWLGIDSSSKIATLLHVSAQTVYNARMKIRNKARADSDTFSEQVRAIGREKLGF